MILFMLIAVLEQGIEFYKESRDYKVSDVVADWETVPTFYNLWMLKEIGEGLKNE